MEALGWTETGLDLCSSEEGFVMNTSPSSHLLLKLQRFPPSANPGLLRCLGFLPLHAELARETEQRVTEGNGVIYSNRSLERTMR